MQIRAIQHGNMAELNSVVALSMMATWEGTPEARADRSIIPGFSFKERKGLYGRSIGRPDFGVFVAVDEHGFVRGCSVVRIATNSKGQPYGHWIDLYVEPDWRRHGLGSGLLAETERFCAGQGAAYVYVEAHAANAKAIQLFQKFGFRLTDARQGRFWFYPGFKRLAGSLPPQD